MEVPQRATLTKGVLGADCRFVALLFPDMFVYSRLIQRILDCFLLAFFELFFASG